MSEVFDGVDPETYEKVKAYHKKNPHIWAAFERYALQAAQLRKRHSAKTIMERVRWDCEFERLGEFKISNDYTAYYARAFARKYPQYRNFFKMKKTRGLGSSRRSFWRKAA